MRYAIHRVIKELSLDYIITNVTVGGSGNAEVVLWDRPHDSYFTLRIKSDATTTQQSLTVEVRGQLRERLAAHARGDFGSDRMPVRPTVYSRLRRTTKQS